MILPAELWMHITVLTIHTVIPSQCSVRKAPINSEVLEPAICDGYQSTLFTPTILHSRPSRICISSTTRASASRQRVGLASRWTPPSSGSNRSLPTGWWQTLVAVTPRSLPLSRRFYSIPQAYAIPSECWERICYSMSACTNCSKGYHF